MKEKIIDCIIFNSNVGLLNFRIGEVINLVDFIYIIFHGEMKKKILSSDDFLYRDNIKIKILESESEVIDEFSDSRPLLLKEELNFDNIISISNENELPDYTKYSDIIKELPFSPIILLQKKYTWSLGYFDEKHHKGTKVFLFTDFFKFERLIVSGPKKKLSEKFYETHENGWSFFGFDIDDSPLKSNLLPFGNINKFETNTLIKSSGDPSFNHIYEFIEKREPKIRDKKIFYIGDAESDTFFDERMIFIKTNTLSLQSEFNEIFIPSYDLYESNNFEIEYFLNEVKKYMLILFPLPHDEIVFNFEFMKESKKILWGEIEKGNLLELVLKK